MMVIFRWAIWGEHYNVFMLNHSIATFQHFFRDEARYVVFTDHRAALLAQLLVSAEVYQFDSYPAPQYLDKEATWRKWAPMCRFDPACIEIRVDADMFLLADPVEIREFCSPSNKQKPFLVTLENFTALWPYGNFGPRLPGNFTPINAGLIGQYARRDLSPLLFEAYNWWKKHIAKENVKYHDEQGAIAYILQHLLNQGEVMELPPGRYRVVCPLNEPAVTSVEGIVLLHATYPEHPAFYQFLPEISAISHLATK